MFNYSDTKIEEVEQIFNPHCRVPFFQHVTSIEATTINGRLTNIYKVRENLLESQAYLFYWVRALPGERLIECSCSWHRCTDELCQHIAAVLLFKWFELTGESRYVRAKNGQDWPGLGEGPLVQRQAREISFLHFEFDDNALRDRLIELRQRYQNPIIRRRWYDRPLKPNSPKRV